MPTKKTLLFLLLQFAAAQAFATHIVGGQLNYECLGFDNQYRITLTVFRDCYNGIPQFDQPASVGFFAASNQYLFQILVEHGRRDTIPYGLVDPCGVIPTNFCVERTTYIDTVQLPFRTGGYQMAYQRCCRNYTINNIVNPDDVGATYYSLITEDALRGCNRSCFFKNWPAPLICANKPIVFDHSATDADGDSLVYKLCTPFLGADTSAAGARPQPPNPPNYIPITWQPPYSLNDMMGGVPLRINPKTGLLTGTPNTVGQFVVGVCVEEYRNKKLISTTRRDFQYNVGRCGKIYVSAFFAPQVQCDGKTISFDNRSNGAANFKWDFGNLGSATDTSSSRSPSYTYSDTGCYKVRLIAEPNKPCNDTSTQTVCIRNSTINADFDLKYLACNDTLKLKFKDKSTDPLWQITNWLWTWDGGGSSTAQNPSITVVGNSPTFGVTLVATSKNGCQKKYSKQIPIERFAVGIPDTLTICKGLSININSSRRPTNGTFRWLPNDGSLDNPNSPNPTATPTKTTTYTSVFETYNLDTCSATRSVTVQVVDTKPIVDATIDKTNVFANQPYNIDITSYQNGTTYVWLPNPYFNDTDVRAHSLTANESTFFIAKATNIYGCERYDTVKINVISAVCDVPYIFVPNSFTPNGDRENDVLLVRSTVTTEIYFAVYNRWGEKVFETYDLNSGWDGTYKNEPLPPDSYGYYLRAKCFGGKEYSKKGNVTLLK